MQVKPFGVLIRTDSKNRVTAINSSRFAEGGGWMQIDEGYGDKYHHAQSNYLPMPLTDERGIFRYRLVGDKVIERTPEEMDADFTPVEQQPTILDRVEAQVLYTALMTDTMIEGSGEM